MAVALVAKNILDETEAAEWLGYSEITLRSWRSKSRATGKLVGPAWVEISSSMGKRPRIRYRLNDLDAFVTRGIITLQPQKKRGRPRKSEIIDDHV